MKKIAVIGSDARQQELRRRFGEYLTELSDAQAVVLPLPASADEKFLRAVPPDALIIGGRFDGLSLAVLNGRLVYDYTKREDFAILNAVATAEGAIAILMEKLPTTVDGSEILIVGNGRIGRTLARKLKLLGAHTTVSARRADDFAEIESEGHRCMATGGIYTAADSFDAVVNTVPAPVIDRRFLERMRTGAFIVDLASAPGGTDFGCAEELGICAVHALALPGRVAPLSAADYAYRSIRNIISEVEENGE